MLLLSCIWRRVPPGAFDIPFGWCLFLRRWVRPSIGCPKASMFPAWFWMLCVSEVWSEWLCLDFDRFCWASTTCWLNVEWAILQLTSFGPSFKDPAWNLRWFEVGPKTKPSQALNTQHDAHRPADNDSERSYLFHTFGQCYWALLSLSWVWCGVVCCGVVPETWSAILYYIILFCNLLYHIILYYTIPYHAMLCYTILYYTILYYTILYYSTLCFTIPYYTVLYYTVL
jgi:hypothetical protein